MKKIFTLSVAYLLLAVTTFGQTTEAQCPTIFDIKRNNGGNFPQGPGTCGGDAEIRVYFDACPSNPPRLDSIYYEGKKLQGLEFGHSNVRDGYPDVSHCSKNNGYLSYCVYGTNIPPAKKLTFYFTYTFPAGQVPKECEVPEGGPLPVNVTSFLAGRIGNAVSLNWKTETAPGSINFEIQRSNDNRTFNTIASIAGTTVSAYSFTDNNNTAKTMSFYRIRIVKQSGEISYSDIRTVKGLASKMDFSLFPNPSAGNARITISDVSEPTRVQLIDNSGRVVKTLMLNNTNSIDLNGLQKGSYMVKIIGSVSGSSEVKKLTVIN